ncbi:hypothetical protein KL921_002052 [Ogataea angusta]|uniref:Transcription activator GCR1-like domain-containing protein n=1 Tax=Pichia angusta TaxID=870730 RepID=A0AAN6I664_PICAN|nr:uncharacterized protein KL928_002235 [Ogataea angusta]KAG7811786.1 hypothetical protein KL921_002052 [Ogataea angusta]KAG7819561.1 hypothetical protein KL928_002235 [Ogataea angusta]KAG7830868.1 hypothetical protein KL920_001459 [Ogataea angusta]KAG7835087.1 hypothetical protein KL943_002402 [Ogataea angusta]KAG7840489.1 hypothetical protein KL942_002440 [Ogataea angusta]
MSNQDERIAQANVPNTSEHLNTLFLTQLKDLSESIATSFDSISNSLAELRNKAGSIATLAATLSDTYESNQQQNGGDSKISAKDIDARLMMFQVAQQAQNGLPKHGLEQDSLGAVKKQKTMSESLPDDELDHSGKSYSNDANLPEVDLNSRAKSVQDLWEEWNIGYRNQEPLKSLERRYGTRWRRGRIAKSAQRRKKVIEFIESEAKRNPGVTEEDVVRLLENYRIKKNKGLFWLYGALPNHLFNANGEPIEFLTEGNDMQSKDEGMTDESEATAAAVAAAAAAASVKQ